MDKRWILILIIIIIGLGAMYYVIVNSTTVGSAVTIVGDLSVTVPHGFKIAENNGDNAKLIDDRTNETIEIYNLGKGDIVNANKKELLYLFKNDTDNEVIDTSGNETVKSITYTNLKTNETETIYITCIQNHTINLIMKEFSDSQQQEKNLNFIIDTMKPDYKQKQT